MIRVIDESGSAEAATSPSHGSDDFGKESPSNAAMDNTPGRRAASEATDWQAAFGSLGEMIYTARARIRLRTY